MSCSGRSLILNRIEVPLDFEIRTTAQVPAIGRMQSRCRTRAAGFRETRLMTIRETAQKSLDFDDCRALTEPASAHRARVDSQAQGMMIRLLPRILAVARAISFWCA
jgi:hypothetical protein